jgi:GNAT superfamily N-acetyltransferase
VLNVIPLNRHAAADRRRFIRLPFALYREDPHWVPPLNQAQHRLLSNHEPFYEHGDVQLFLAVRAGRDVGRVAAIENRHHNEFQQDKTGFVGFFECEHDGEAAQGLFNAAGNWLKTKNLNRMRGPVNLSTNHTVGLLVAGEPGPPMVDMTYNPRYYEELFLKAGFIKVMDVVAHALDIKTPAAIDRLKKLSARIEARNNITTRSLDLTHFEQEIEILEAIYNSAWEKNWGFVPLTRKEFHHLAKDLKMVVDPDLVRLVFVDGKPAGFLAAIFNLNEILIRLKGKLFPWGIFKIILGRSKIKSLRLLLLGIIKEYRHRGLETVLYHHALQHALVRGYTWCENSWLLETNRQVIQASEFMGGREYRRYRILEKALDDTGRGARHG